MSKNNKNNKTYSDFSDISDVSDSSITESESYEMLIESTPKGINTNDFREHSYLDRHPSAKSKIEFVEKNTKKKNAKIQKNTKKKNTKKKETKKKLKEKKKQTLKDVFKLKLPEKQKSFEDKLVELEDSVLACNFCNVIKKINKDKILRTTVFPIIADLMKDEDMDNLYDEFKKLLKPHKIQFDQTISIINSQLIFSLKDKKQKKSLKEIFKAIKHYNTYC